MFIVYHERFIFLISSICDKGLTSLSIFFAITGYAIFVSYRAILFSSQRIKDTHYYVKNVMIGTVQMSR